MKMLRNTMLVTMFSLLAAGQVLAAASSQGCASSGGIANGCGGSPSISAPEIDAASGIVPFALMIGIVLLMKERSRSKRSSKSDG